MIGNELYEEIVKEIKVIYPDISSMEIERIVDSQFRVIRDTMSKREGKVIQLIYLGKFRPTAYNQDYVKVKRNT
jgi:nucleoid DNA-binding protein